MEFPLVAFPGFAFTPVFRLPPEEQLGGMWFQKNPCRKPMEKYPQIQWLTNYANPNNSKQDLDKKDKVTHRNWSDEDLCNLNGYIDVWEMVTFLYIFPLKRLKVYNLKNPIMFHDSMFKLRGRTIWPRLIRWFLSHNLPSRCHERFFNLSLAWSLRTWREDVKKSCIGTTFSRWYFQIILFFWMKYNFFFMSMSSQKKMTWNIYNISCFVLFFYLYIYMW